MKSNRHFAILSIVALPFMVFAVFVACIPAGQQLPGLPTDSAVPTVSSTAPGPENGSLKILEISPAQAPSRNGMIALIHGAGFKPWLKVRFGDLESSDVKIIDESMLTAVIPPQPPGSFDVILSDGEGGKERLVALQGGFTFLNGIPPSSDDDGLSADFEVNGWDIEVDRFGFGLNPAHIIRYTVTSDPDLDDTDGDGLSDAEEYFGKTNPRSIDTDGDGLWDGEEVNRWDTSPVSVDSDGDASGAPAGSGISNAPPSASLFDGNELYDPAQLILPPSQRGPIKPDATSPSMDDTDGDGVSDNDESGSTMRTPLFADLPKLRARIVDAVDVRLDVEYGEEQGQTTGYNTELSTTAETTEGRSNAETISQSTTIGVEVGYEAGAITTTGTFEFSVGHESSVEVSKESTQSASQTFGQYAEDSRVKTETSATGSMSAGLEILNEGNIAFKLTSLGMAVRQLQPIRDPLSLSTPPQFKTLATLRPDLSNGLTLAPGASSGVIQVEATEVNADRVKSLLASPSRMYIDPAAFEIENAEGINFAFIQEVTIGRTARILLDYGDGNAINTRIATNVNRNEDGSLAGVTLASAMDLLVGAGNWESRPVNDLQPSAVTPIGLLDGSFESPQYFHANGQPQYWTSNDASLVWAYNLIPLAPDGHQWLQILPNGSAHQQIGSVSDNGSYQFSFVQAALSQSNTVRIELWRYEPGSPLSIMLDAKSFTLSSNSSPATRTGTLSAGLGHNGLPLYIVLRQTSGDVAYVDNLSMRAVSSNPKVLWRVNNTQNKLDSRPRMWVVYINADDQTGKDFDNVVLQFNDAVIIALAEDADGDGLTSVQEQHYGTSDILPDTDADGLSDALETRGEYRVPALPGGELRQGGWTVTVTGKPAYRVFSDSTRSDSDGDGLTDRQEYLGKDNIAPGSAGDHNDATDPLLADTDGDGISDALDPAPVTPATILYVNASATGANNGQSWTNAYTQLSTALSTAYTRNTDSTSQNDVSEIWVARGTYTPMTNVLFGTFLLPPRTAVYGGFTGGETKLSQRNPDGVTNGTVLHRNATAIVTSSASQQGLSVLDGFLLEGATGTSPALDIPLFAYSDSLIVRHCFFYNNSCNRQYGAAAYAAGHATVTFEDCVFANNRVTNPNPSGAALAVIQDTIVLNRCTFIGNVTDATNPTGPTRGGAVAIQGSNFAITDCRFEQNFLAAELVGTQPAGGGAVAIVDDGNVIPSNGTISNCNFRNNEVEGSLTNPGAQWSANRAGGGLAVFGTGTNVNVVNCAFWQNRAQSFGGGAYVATGATAKFVNCTFNRNVLSLVPSVVQTCGTQKTLDPFAVGAGIGAAGTTFVENCVLWGNIGSDSFRTQPTAGGAIVTRNLGQEKQISPFPYWPTVVGGCTWLASGTVSFNNTCVEKQGVEVHFTGSVGGLGNIGLDPMLASQDLGNLLLTSGSPCIDSGNNLVNVDITKGGLQFLPAFDLADKARTVDGNGDGQSAVDMGAFESQP